MKSKLWNVKLKILINTTCSKNNNLKHTVVIQHQLVEVASGRFLADILMYHFLSQPVQSDRVSQRLAATLQGKRDRCVTDAESLPIDRADGNAPVIRIHPCQLWYIRGDLALRVRLAFPIEVLYVLGETRPIGYNELVSERPRDQHYVRIYNSVTWLKKKKKIYYSIRFTKIFCKNLSTFDFLY